MIDIRYHIYSIAAIFLALAIGIVIGSSFAKSSPSDSTDRRIIQRYENDMNTLKVEITKKTRTAADSEIKAKQYQDFCHTIMPFVIKDKLLWRHVAIIRTGDYDDLTGSVKQTLETAGAQVTSITDIQRDFQFDDDQKISEALTNAGLGPGSDAKQSRDKLYRVLVSAICSGKYANIVSRFETAGIAKFTGDYYRPMKLVVLIGGATSPDTDTAEALDSQIISQLEKLGITVVGCEPANAGSSYIPEWHKMGIATVDNANTAIGQLDLIYALNGETASFGIKDTADRLIPQTLEKK